MDWRKFLFSMDGRASRSDYWLFLGISFGCAVCVAIVVSSMGAWQAYAANAGAFNFILQLSLLRPAIAIGIRRLHDRARNEDWIFLFLGLPFASNLIVTILNLGRWNVGIFLWPLFLLQTASSVAAIWGLIEFGFLRGTVGENRSGPDPIPSSDTSDTAYVGPGYSVKVTYRDDSGKVDRQEFFYIAAGSPEEARTVIQQARGVSENAVAILGPLLHETVQRLNLSPGNFVPAPRAR